MCGIIGINGATEVCFDLLSGLKRLEYRGYDSAGIVTLYNGSFSRQRAQGKLVNLERKLKECPVPGNVGIGHTRWATHGAPTELNAHPHQGKHVALVHNGIIENHAELRANLKDVPFESETDSEVIVHLLDAYLDKGCDWGEAIHALLQDLKGAYALAILFKEWPDVLVGVCSGSPLVVGYGTEERLFLASDVVAFAPSCAEATYLEEGDWVELNKGQVTIHPKKALSTVTRPRVPISRDQECITKEGYQHFMLKEIMEQPTVLDRALKMYRTQDCQITKKYDWKQISSLSIIACGTSFYAGCVAKYWFEKIGRLPVSVDIASEFRYRDPTLLPGSCALFISQSGETADTIAALRFVKQKGIPCIGLVNVPESSIAREADSILQTQAGIEVGVASTKAFIAQLAILSALVVEIASLRGTIPHEEKASLQQDLMAISGLVTETLKLSIPLQTLAPRFGQSKTALYLGRGSLYPIALEGALKLKEISYIHAEGYAAGELKHGPIALIDDKMLIIVLAPYNDLFEKILSNVQEVLARKGQVVFFTDTHGMRALGQLESQITVYILPAVSPFLVPIVYTIPMQLLAYYVATFKGADIDQPRNLAKSVTVE
ncbi:MAG: glutamine--fructose-6-phosphate transaminase (isomerizing) [Holosporales bacterium]|jgi:glucosamine--fructose-6-phosphate aminotransferase (isomerizing)|nr:glutamine--fructose-6-phosphate transaminase (isomerizing) [Holosporales bacterium]